MSEMKIQLNHPGKQKKFKIGSGYIEIGKDYIREWNSDKNHFRKFIQNQGQFVTNVKDAKPTRDDLYFWGEWEGYSFVNFFPENSCEKFPNGLHKLFHSIVNRGTQNTDPYVYGKEFKYCVCKQTSTLTDCLKLDDLILFGTVMPSINKFYIDTVFIVKDSTESLKVQKTSGAGYSEIYKQETLEQLDSYLGPDKYENKNKIYHSKTWWDDKDYFSFVPCKLSFDNGGFERLYIKLDTKKFQLSKNPTGKSFLQKSKLSAKELWDEIVQISLHQGFKLGVRFDEPIFNNCLENSKKTATTNIRSAKGGKIC